MSFATWLMSGPAIPFPSSSRRRLVEAALRAERSEQPQVFIRTRRPRREPLASVA